MLQRCNNPQQQDFKNYGGRGILVCKAWHKFEIFCGWALKNGYKDNLTLDRKNTNGNYCASNCRWATRCQQAQSQRKKRNSQTPFIGVSWNGRRNQWQTRVQGDGRHLGYFDDPFSAAWVRDAYVKQYYDKYATLNNLKDRRKHKKTVEIERRVTFNWAKVLNK
jgi:hypothetical protein